MTMLRRAVIALTTLSLFAISLEARPYAVEDLLQQEGIGRMAADPSGRWLVVEKHESFLAMERFDRLSRGEVLRSRLYRADLHHPEAARPLLADDPGPGIIILGFSPGGTRLAIGRFHAGRFTLGIVNMADGAVRWWPLVPSYDPFHRGIAWTSEDRLLLLAEKDMAAPWWLAGDDAFAQGATHRWAASATGKLGVTVASILGAGGARRSSRRLVRLDLDTGHAVTVAEGPFLALALTLRGDTALVVEDGMPRSLDASTAVHDNEGPFGRSLLLVDLHGGRIWRPCAACDLIGHPVWTGSRLRFLVRSGDGKRGRRCLLLDMAARKSSPCSGKMILASADAAEGESLDEGLASLEVHGAEAMVRVSRGQTKRLALRMEAGDQVERARAPSAGGPAIVAITDVHGGGRLSVLDGRASVTLLAWNNHLRDVDPAIMIPLNHVSADRHGLRSWLFLPPGPCTGQRLPLVVIPYPGLVFGIAPPADQRLGAERFHASAQLLAAAGYAVLLPSMPMPMTLPDDGFAFAGLIGPAVDAAVATGRIDPARVGLWGHSYGAYAAAMILAQTRRFAAATLSSGIYDLAGAVGTFSPLVRAEPERGLPVASRYGWAESGQGRMGAPPWRTPLRYLANSPVYLADRIHAPLLIFAADRDVSPVGQAEQLFSALARQGRDVDLVTYWGEGHVVGSPANLRDLYARVLAFFAKWLKAVPGSPAHAAAG